MDTVFPFALSGLATQRMAEPIATGPAKGCKRCSGYRLAGRVQKF
jgi:hypothetical protein